MGTTEGGPFLPAILVRTGSFGRSRRRAVFTPASAPLAAMSSASSSLGTLPMIPAGAPPTGVVEHAFTPRVATVPRHAAAAAFGLETPNKACEPRNDPGRELGIQGFA